MGYEKLRRMDLTIETTTRRQCADGVTTTAPQHDDDVLTARRRQTDGITTA